MDTRFKNEVWEKEKYWAIAEKGSRDTEHPGMKLLLKIAQGKHKILDLGCGEGTRLSLLAGMGEGLTGIDISSMAIKKARAKYSGIDFVSGNIEKLPFDNESFDFVYSAFVFEHLDDVEAVIKQAIRVLKPEENLLLVSPNYGAPNRASPPFKGSRIKKLFRGFKKDLFRPFSRTKNLDWEKVTPIANANTYEIDWDTTVEPYLGSLIPFVKGLGLKVIKTDSSWEEEREGANFMQKVFRFFGEGNIYPFRYWGPHLLILTEKYTGSLEGKPGY